MTKKKVVGIVKEVRIALGKHTPVPRKPAIIVKPKTSNNDSK